MIDKDFWFYAVVGAIVTAITSFIPISPLYGGVVASYLHGKDGLKVGTASGVLAMIISLSEPLIIGAIMGSPMHFLNMNSSYLPWTLVALNYLKYIVLGALGGYLGVYILSKTSENTDEV